MSPTHFLELSHKSFPQAHYLIRCVASSPFPAPALLAFPPDAYARHLDMDYKANLVPRLQADVCTMHGLAAAGPGCGAAFPDVTDLEGHMTTHDFSSLINSDLGPATTFSGSTPNTPPTFRALIGNTYTNNTFPNIDAGIFANPAGPSISFASPPTSFVRPPSTSIVPSVQSPARPVTGTAAATPPRHACTHPTCTSTFKHTSDLRRHARVHQPDAKKHQCFVPGCQYRGAKGFLRRDKLLSHQRNAHGLRY